MRRKRVLYYSSYWMCIGNKFNGKKVYQAFMAGKENPIKLTSPTIQAVVAYARKYDLTLKRVD